MSETEIIDPAPPAVKIGTAQGLNSATATRLFEKASEKINPGDQLIIFFGHNKRSTVQQMKAKEEAIMAVLMRRYIKDPSRITRVRHGKSRDMMEIWLVPPGADIPRCDECDKPKQVAYK